MSGPHRSADHEIKDGFGLLAEPTDERWDFPAGHGEVLALKTDMFDFVTKNPATLKFEQFTGSHAENCGVINFRHQLDHDHHTGPDRVIRDGVAAVAKKFIAEIFRLFRDAKLVQPVTEGRAVSLFFQNEKIHRLQKIEVPVRGGILAGSRAEMAAIRSLAKLPGREGFLERRSNPRREIVIGSGLIMGRADLGSIQLIISNPLT